MATRKDCIEQAKNYLLEGFLDELKVGSIDCKTLMQLKDVLNIPEEPEIFSPVPLKCSEITGVGIGWLEQNCEDPDDPDFEGDVIPCVFIDRYAFDGENEEWSIDEEARAGEYNHWHPGFRVWSDGREPNMEERASWEWRK